MTIPETIYHRLTAWKDTQENIEYDSNGNELYHGVAEGVATNAQPLWIIAKMVYTPTQINGSTVYLMTHVSFLRGQIWDDRASITFP